MLRKQGIKGTPNDGPITEHLQFSRIKWNQIYSDMPRGHRARAAEKPKMMDMDKPVEPPVDLIAEPDAANEEEAKYEDMVTYQTL
jgi:hypothetical protein